MLQKWVQDYYIKSIYNNDLFLKKIYNNDLELIKYFLFQKYGQAKKIMVHLYIICAVAFHYVEPTLTTEKNRLLDQKLISTSTV